MNFRLCCHIPVSNISNRVHLGMLRNVFTFICWSSRLLPNPYILSQHEPAERLRRATLLQDYSNLSLNSK